MTQKQLIIAAGLGALLVVLYVGKQTYPRWGAILRQSEGK